MGPALSRGRLAALTGGLVGAAAMIAGVTVLSRVLGFARTVVQMREVGATDLGNAYNTANILPNILFEVAAGGALAGAVVPLLAGPIARRMRGDVDRIASALLGWTLAVLVPLAVVVALLADPIADLLVQAPGSTQAVLAAGFLRVFAIQIPLYGVAVTLIGILQAHRRFLGPALAPLVSSVVVVAVYLVYGAMVADPTDTASVGTDALAVLAWGTTAGVVALSLPMLWPLHRTGVRLRPTLRFPPGVLARARSLAFAGVGALVAQQLSVLVSVLLVNRHGEQSYPVLLSLQAVYFFPYAILAVPLATATFPRLAERGAAGDTAGFARLSTTTTRAVLAVAALGATVLIAAAPAVERFFQVFGTGSFTGMGSGLAWTAPGLLGYALVFHLSRTLYALERGRPAALATAAGWAATAAVGAVAVPWWTGGGRDQASALAALGLANTVGMTVAGIGLVLAVARTAGRDAVAGVVRTTLVLVVAGAGGALAGQLLAGAGDGLAHAGSLGAVARGVLAACAAGAVFVAVVGLLDRSVLRELRPSAFRQH